MRSMMAEFVVRIEYEKDVEADPQALSKLVGFCVSRVLLECERRDFPPHGMLEVEPLRMSTEEIAIAGARIQPVWLRFSVEDSQRGRWRSAMQAMRQALGLPEPELLEA